VEYREDTKPRENPQAPFKIIRLLRCKKNSTKINDLSVLSTSFEKNLQPKQKKPKQIKTVKGKKSTHTV